MVLTLVPTPSPPPPKFLLNHLDEVRCVHGDGDTPPHMNPNRGRQSLLLWKNCVASRHCPIPPRPPLPLCPCPPYLSLYNNFPLRRSPVVITIAETSRYFSPVIPLATMSSTPHTLGGGVILVGARAFQGFLDSYMAPKEAVDVPLLFPFCANCDRQNLARMRPLKGYCICSNIMNAKDRHPKRNPEPKHTHITMEFSTKFNNKYWYLYLRLVTKT